MAELASCSEEDLKEAELPLGPRKKLINYLQARSVDNIWNTYQVFFILIFYRKGSKNLLVWLKGGFLSNK